MHEHRPRRRTGSSTAIKAQAEELAYAGPGMATRVRAEIGPLLAAVTPGDLDTFFFTLGGAEANENAIRLARAYTGPAQDHDPLPLATTARRPAPSR